MKGQFLPIKICVRVHLRSSESREVNKMTEWMRDEVPEMVYSPETFLTNTPLCTASVITNTGLFDCEAYDLIYVFNALEVL